MNIKEMIAAKFGEQKIRADVPSKCPHCGMPIKFNLEHTQNTTVDTKILEITKG